MRSISKIRHIQESNFKLEKRILSEEDETQSMMDVSSDSDWYQMRKREVSIAQNDLSTILSIAYRWCKGKENLPDCQNVNSLYMKHYL